MGFFDTEVGSASISWNDARPKDKIKGVIVPDSEGRAYVESNQTDIDTGDVLTYKDGSPRKQAVLNLAGTGLTDWAFATDQFKAKAAEDDEMVDDGQRRLFVRGASMTKGFEAALRKIKAKDVVPGMTVEVELTQRKPIPNSKYKENIFTVTVSAPTEASMAVVAQHADSGGSLSTGSDDANAGKSDDDEPPF